MAHGGAYIIVFKIMFRFATETVYRYIIDTIACRCNYSLGIKTGVLHLALGKRSRDDNTLTGDVMTGSRRSAQHLSVAGARALARARGRLARDHPFQGPGCCRVCHCFERAVIVGARQTSLCGKFQIR